MVLPEPKDLNPSLTIFLWLLVVALRSGAIQYVDPQRIGDWEHVTGFAIHPEENYMILALNQQGLEQLYETHKLNDQWSSPKPLDAINNFRGGSSIIGGPNFDHNGSVLYFHANYEGGSGGFDIYYANKTGNHWSEPIHMGEPVNSSADELYPAMAPGKVRFFFSRHNTDSDVKKPRFSPDCHTLYGMYMNNQGEWEQPEPLHDALNRACEHGIFVAADGKSIYFSSVDQDNHRDGYNIYYANELHRGNWVLPLLIESLASDETNINPRLAGEHIYYLKQSAGRSNDIGSIFKTKLPKENQPLLTLKEHGTILSLEEQKPIHAQLTVFNPTTLEVLGIYDTNVETGHYDIPLLDNFNYIVDVRSPGYSFASFQSNFRNGEQRFDPKHFELFNKTELLLSIYDGEVFRPLEAKVWASSLANKSIIDAVMRSPGTYSLTLPIGGNYQVHASAKGFQNSHFNFNLFGDIIFSQFHRDLPLTPVKTPVDIHVVDAETGSAVAAEIHIENLLREETISLLPSALSGGQVTIELREEDHYEFTVRGAMGYSFYNKVLAIHADSSPLIIELAPLKTEIAIILNNIHFATNSAELTSESFHELNRVAEMIIENPTIIIEIMAHTDDQGSDAYNMILSGRRAQSVVNYLNESNIPLNRLVSNGYGKTNPLVPNTSEENRAMNRRVEFKIIDFREEE